MESEFGILIIDKAHQNTINSLNIDLNCFYVKCYGYIELRLTLEKGKCKNHRYLVSLLRLLTHFRPSLLGHTRFHLHKLVPCMSNRIETRKLFFQHAIRHQFYARRLHNHL